MMLFDENYRTVFSYVTPYGNDELMLGEDGYAVVCNTLRGYNALMSKVPLDFCGNIYVPCEFADIKQPFFELRPTGRSIEDGFELMRFERIKSRGFEFSFIDSKKNSVYGELHKADSLGFRKANRLFVLEEERLVRRAVDDRLDVMYIIYTNKTALLADNTIERARAMGIPCFSINDGLMSSLTSTHPIPKELALCRMPSYTIDSLQASGRSAVLIADNIENPDNLGLIIRTADACGADAVISVGKQASVYHKNCVRAARGAMGRLPIFEYEVSEFNELIGKLKNAGYKIYGSSAKTKLTVHNTDQVEKRAFAVSNETHGISDMLFSAADEMIKIPMASGQSSFNVAVAAGIILSGAIRF